MTFPTPLGHDVMNALRRLLPKDTYVLQFKEFPSIIPSMGRFDTVTSVGAKYYANMRCTVPS